MRTEILSNCGSVGDNNNNSRIFEKSDQEEKFDKRDNCLEEEMQDLYPRSYSLGSCRPTMISAKYRQKEERRKMLKMSMNKLKRIEDPESSLCRSVLINNTVKRLQREAKEDKLQKTTQNKCFGITSDFIARQEENLKTDVFSTSRTNDQLSDITNLRDNLSKYSGKLSCDYMENPESISAELDITILRSSRCSATATTTTGTTTTTTTSTGTTTTSISCSLSSRKRPHELEDDCCDMLSQFYLSPSSSVCSSVPSRMIVSLEEDEDVNVVDIDTSPPISIHLDHSVKRRKTEEHCQTAADRLRDNLPSSLSSAVPPLLDEWTIDDSLLQSPITSSFTPTSIGCLSPSNCSSPQSQSSHQANSSPFSCGHSSLLNEIVVYHNLIASLES